MTDNEIIKAVAELDGWSFANQYTANAPYIATKNYGTMKFQGIAALEQFAYLASYDAILPVIGKQDEAAQMKTIIELYNIKWSVMPDESSFIGIDGCADLMFLSTPRQLCIAFLIATGKYNE